MQRAFIGLGSNVGDRVAALREALEGLARGGARAGIQSSIYRTDPVEVTDQEEFMNQVVACDTGLAPLHLLGLCLELEQSMGRVRTRAKGPRVLDLDLLLYGDLVLHAGGLEVPHPRFHLRRFVLVPLTEIAPEVRHPVLGLTAAEMLRRCPDRSRVDRL